MLNFAPTQNPGANFFEICGPRHAHPHAHPHGHHHHHRHCPDRHRPHGPFYLKQPCDPRAGHKGQQPPRLGEGQLSYLDKLQQNDQKKQEATNRLQQMGFQPETGLMLLTHKGDPAGTSYWRRGDGQTVKMLPDGTVAP